MNNTVKIVKMESEETGNIRFRQVLYQEIQLHGIPCNWDIFSFKAGLNYIISVYVGFTAHLTLCEEIKYKSF